MRALYAMLLFGIASMVGLATPAHAYLDPGTASIILQGIVAGVAAVAGTAALYWHKTKEFFSRIFGASKKKTD